MKLTFLGTGSAFTVGTGNYHSNMLLASPSGKKLLIDCGTDARFSLFEQNLSYRDITDIYISHLHADHSGGLECLGLQVKFDPQAKKPMLHISEELVEDLWHRSLAGGMSTLQGEVAELTSYFNVNNIGPDLCFDWEGIQFELVKTYHIMHGHEYAPSYGLFFSVNGKKVFVTTDVQYLPDTYMHYYQAADIIFHDCETNAHPSGVHAHYKELKQLEPKIRGKIWLYHYQPGELPDAKADGFNGFVQKGQMFEI